eukprot:9371927-Prorocentrum_lima.AAC.1
MSGRKPQTPKRRKPKGPADTNRPTSKKRHPKSKEDNDKKRSKWESGKEHDDGKDCSNVATD